MYDGRGVANFILDYADNNNVVVTNLALQKLVYFCHAWFMVSTGVPLVRHHFEAWEFGPVLPYLYRDFKHFGEKKIEGRAFKLDLNTGKKIVASIDLCSEKKVVLTDIVRFFSRLSARQLVDYSHVEGGPWHKVWNYEGKINPGMKISNDEIVAFYSSQDRFYTLQ